MPGVNDLAMAGDVTKAGTVLGAEYWKVPKGWSLDQMSDDWYRTHFTAAGFTGRLGLGVTQTGGTPQRNFTEREIHNRWASAWHLTRDLSFGWSDVLASWHDLFLALAPRGFTPSWRHVDPVTVKTPIEQATPRPTSAVYMGIARHDELKRIRSEALPSDTPLIQPAIDTPRLAAAIEAAQTREERVKVLVEEMHIPEELAQEIARDFERVDPPEDELN